MAYKQRKTMRVLITGKDSYIGLNIRSYLEKHNYSVDEADMLTDAWKDYDFSNYETVIHVAAVVHENAKSSDWEKFKKVNVQLVKDVAAKAKAEEEKRKKAEEEAKKKAEAEARKKAEEEAKKKAAEELAAKAEEEARKKAAEEAATQIIA